MLRKKFIIPMVAIMSVASGTSALASETPVNKNDTTVIYKQAEVTSKSGLNVRTSPAIENNNKITAVPIGTELGILEQKNDWYKVKLESNNEAYVNSNYVKVNNSNLYVNVDRLNFREGAGMDKKIYTVLTKGTKLEFIEESGNWVKVKVNNTTGYVHSKYISNVKPIVQTESAVDSNKKPTSNSSNTNSSKNEDNKTEKPESNKTETENSNKKPNKTESDKGTQVDKEEVQKPQSNNSSTSKPETSKPESKPETSKPESKPETSKPESKPETSKPESKPENNESSQSKDVQAVIDLAYSQIGKPYNWGSEGPSSFDCSGLMRYIFDKGAGVNLPRTSKAQSQYGTTVSRSNLKPGDLIFSSTDGSGTVSHVGIYVGGGQMIHAPKPGDVVKKSSINSSYWNDAYLWAKRVM